ncbi:hypothetical protein TRVA0_001S04478 [Trichomonascus vanleenenianus]|uniref:resistance to Congo red protein n=1 Tax=Trichomonascus vanleenenianus TaxID=2268995 RepID=UPI003ECB6E31
MAAILSREVDPQLVRRFMYGCDIYGNCSGWYNWGRWILLGIIIFVFFLIFLATCKRTRKRVRSGQAPIYGTAWMVPPSYYQSQQQYQQQPVPVYHAQPGVGDAGYYDQNGNFVSREIPPSQPGQSSAGYVPPPEPAHAPNWQQSGSYEMNNYPPPNYPPPKS